MPRIPDYYRCENCQHHVGDRCEIDRRVTPSWFGCKLFEMKNVEDDGK